jgi:hypothetical protein
MKPSSIAMFLSNAAADYSKLAEQTTKESKPRASVKREVKASNAETLPAKHNAGTTESLPAIGTLDAAGFIKALRNAGLRPNDKGIMRYTDSVNERSDQKYALAGFVGFSYSEPLGSQLDAARLAANRALRVKQTQDQGEYDRNARNTMAGFVAGMPNCQRTLINNLLKREELAAMARDAAVAASRNADLPEETRAYQAQCAALEQARLKAIRSDLAKQGYEPNGK